MAPTSTSGDDPALRRTDLVRARLTIEVEPDGHFGVVGSEGVAEVVAHQLTPPTREEPSASSTCHTLVARGDTTEYVVTDTTPHCVSPVFARADCLATPQTIHDGVLTVRVVAPNGTGLEAVTEQLKRRVPELSVDWLLNGKSEHRAVAADVTKITAKQAEAIETALAFGYYERPRGATLSDLAEELGITDSAVSQRLRGAERKLVTSLFEPTARDPTR